MSSETPTTDSSAAKRPPGTILVVDDEPDVREILKFQLERLGHKVDEASDALVALERLKQEHQYRLIFLDIMMPKMDGLTALAEIRRVSPAVKIVLITASIADETFDQAFGSPEGVDGFINKPLTMANISRCIEVVLEKGGKYLSAL